MEMTEVIEILSQKTGACLPANTIAVYDLMTQGIGASAAMVLT